MHNILIAIGGGAIEVISNMPFINELFDIVLIDTTRADIYEGKRYQFILAGNEILRGYGSAGCAENGYKAIMTIEDEFLKLFKKRGGKKFLISCLSGGTGIGGSLAASSLVKKYKIDSEMLLIMPFDFYIEKNKILAEKTLTEIKKNGANLTVFSFDSSDLETANFSEAFDIQCMNVFAHIVKTL